MLEINDILRGGYLGKTATRNWFLMSLATLAIFGGLVAAVAIPVLIPVPAIVLAALISSGTPLTGLGVYLAVQVNNQIAELRMFSEDLVQSSNFLREVLNELEGMVTDHHHAADVLLKLEEKGFALTRADKMCKTFESLRTAFRNVMAGKTDLTYSSTFTMRDETSTVNTDTNQTVDLESNVDPNEDQ